MLKWVSSSGELFGHWLNQWCRYTLSKWKRSHYVSTEVQDAEACLAAVYFDFKTGFLLGQSKTHYVIEDDLKLPLLLP